MNRNITRQTGLAESGRKYEWKKPAVLLLILAAVIFAGLLLRPAYKRYVEEDHADTCWSARFVMLLWYQQAVEAQLDQGASTGTIDYRETLQQELEGLPEKFTHFSARQLSQEEVRELKDHGGLVIAPDPDCTWQITGMCRSGGTDLLTMDSVSHRLDICCSIHGEYNLGFKPLS